MDFDDSWINKYEKDLKAQERRMRIVKVYYFYINSDKEIQKVNQGIIEVKNGILTRDELLKLIVMNRQKHKLTQILKYIVTDVDENTEFRIKWPRGEMGSLPADSEQYLLIESNLVELEKITERVDAMMNNKVNIDRLIKDVDKLSTQLEILKDKVRANGKDH